MVALVAASACTGSEPGHEGSSPSRLPTANSQPAPMQLTVETFNAGLAHGFVDHASDRIAPVIGALGDSPSDIVCLQEVWRPADREAFSHGLKAAYPYQWFTAVDQEATTNTPACELSVLFGGDGFVSCLRQECSEFSGDAQTDCIIDRCGSALERLKESDAECAQSLMAQVGKPAIQALWTVLRPWGEAGRFSYGGSDGLMLLSKVPLLHPELLDWTSLSTLTRRRALTAEVALDDEVVTIGCTHLSADLTGTAPYAGAFASWSDENHAQVRALVQASQTPDGPRVWLGDFNCSLSNEAQGIDSESPQSCKTLAASGLADAVPAEAVPCTFCADNRLTDTSRSTRLDHIFYRGLDAKGVHRVYDDPSIALPLSDHYGLRAQLVPME